MAKYILLANWDRPEHPQHPELAFQIAKLPFGLILAAAYALQ